jgi:hypothetical protein
MTPAVAGKGDRAQAAIAEARGKVDAANKAGTAGQVPGLQARAQAALRTAEEDVARGDKEQAIADANHASELADMAIGESNKVRMENEQARHADAMATAAAAQQDAAAAKARAEAAEQSAAQAGAQVEAMRNAPPPPAPTTTTVTTEEHNVRATSSPRVVHRVVRRTTPAVSEKKTTTTTVTTGPGSGN